MITDELEKECTKLEKYLIRQGREELVHQLKRMDREELRKKITEYAIYRQEILDARTNDDKLNKVKEEKKELEAPYRENIKMNDKISRFLSMILKDQPDEQT